MQFIHQPLTWAFLLVLVPVLIHLINLMRQRRVKWAAMEFLLQSYKKHRRSVWLKQLLLLLLRMLAIATVVAMLAGLITNDQWSLLGGQSTHHFILLDDSLSMGEQTGGQRAFDQASLALGRIAKQLSQKPTSQKVTLIRFSKAAAESAARQSAVDLNAVEVDTEFPDAMEQLDRDFEVTELAVGPVPALEIAERLMQDTAERSRLVYVLSDFRAQQWNQASELKEALRRLRKKNAELHLIRCSEAQRQNVAVIEVAPEPGTLAAGVPLLVNVKVRNFGPGPAQQVQVRVSARSYPAGVIVREDQVSEEQVTTLLLDGIPAGEVATQQAQVKFERAGGHVVEAAISSDALLADNRRRCLVDIPAAIPVLLVDDSVGGEEAYYLQSVFAPGRVVTGIQPTVRPSSYLRDVADVELKRYAAIYLLDTGRLDPRATAALSRYVNEGGGLAFFAGPNTDPRFLIELYDEGQGLFPLPVQADREPIRAADQGDTPDLQVSDHAIFRALVDEGGENRPLARRIRIDRYLPPDPSWTSEDSPETDVLASVQGLDPLVTTKRYGEGQVVAFLTTASPSWNNWAMGPSFPVVVLQLHGFLASPSATERSQLTGEPIELQLDAAGYRPDVEFRLPRSPAAMRVDGAAATVKKEPDAPQDAPLMKFTLGRDGQTRTGETDWSGIYVARAVSMDGTQVQRRFAVNVPTSDSDLALLRSQELAEQLDELGVQLHNADELEYESSQQDGFSWSHLLAGLLVLLLLGEQLLAYAASYHPKTPTEAPRMRVDGVRNVSARPNLGSSAAAPAWPNSSARQGWKSSGVGKG